nr:RNA-directed DNA polymerase, eukaryota, reverse transcriptase zinc-binding domain protein [Tanacetum cinerariifolium]
MESLHLSFQRVVDVGMFHGIKLGGAPASVLNSIESLRSHFFNGHAPNSKKTSWVSWKKALASKDRGGLGISSLYTMNRGLLLKWVWRFVTQNNSLWNRVIQALHGKTGKIGVVAKDGNKSCWMVIVHEINNLKMIGIDVMKHIRTKLGNGDKTMFWDDKWCAGDSLKDRFSQMYALESSKQITVGLKLSHPNLASSFRRYPRGGIEMEQFVKIEDAVNEINLTRTDDRWVWDLESTGVFSVSSIRNLIDEKTLPVTDFKTISNKLVSIKINILTWKIMRNSLPTRFNISRRGFFTQTAIRVWRRRVIFFFMFVGEELGQPHHTLVESS